MKIAWPDPYPGAYRLEGREDRGLERMQIHLNRGVSRKWKRNTWSRAWR